MSILLVLLAIISGPAPVALALDGEGTLSAAMGGAGLALGLGADSFFANPALLGLSSRKESSFIVTLGAGDELVTHGGKFRLERPTVDGAISFLAKNIALTIQSRTIFEDFTDLGHMSSYRGEKLTVFQLDWAFARPPLSLGLRAQAIAAASRPDVILKSDQILFDFFVQTAIARYDSVEDLSAVSFGLGLLLDYEWIGMGVVVGQFASSSGEDPLLVDSDALLRTLSWGLSLSSPTYNTHNELRLFKVEGALDLINLGSDEDRELRAGLSIKLQLLPDWSVSLLTGYRELKKEARDLLGLAPSNGRHSIALAAQLAQVSLLASYEYPTAWYTRRSVSEKSSFTLMGSIHL